MIQNRIGKQALVTIGCKGMGGVTRTNNVAAVNAGNVLRTGAGTATAFGGRDGAGTIARTTVRVEDATLLKGALGSLISFSAIAVVAEDRRDGRAHARSFAGTRFAGLRVLGVNLPLLGDVVVNEQLLPSTAHGLMRVNGLRIVVATANARI